MDFLGFSWLNLAYLWLFFSVNSRLNLGLLFCENIFKIVCIVSEKIGKLISQFAILFVGPPRRLFTISLKLKVLLQCCSEITWPTVYGSMVWFSFVWLGKANTIQMIPPWRTSPWVANFSSISAVVCLLFKIFCQDNKFFFLKPVSSFPTFVYLEISQNFCYCDLI